MRMSFQFVHAERRLQIETRAPPTAMRYGTAAILCR
jgi:hypothetical protein